MSRIIAAISKNYNKLIAMALITLALVIINLLATVTADQQAMRRESDRAIPVQGVVVLSLDQALNLSLACGDGRRVNWEEVI